MFGANLQSLYLLGLQGLCCGEPAMQGVLFAVLAQQIACCVW
jgi:hypothetical protein